MKYKILLIFLFVFSTSIFSQNDEKKTDDVPFAIIEKVPVYPGCGGEDNKTLKKCMSEKITAHVSGKFKKKVITKLNLSPGSYRISVQFKIDKKGKVVNVRARSDYPELEKEAIRVVKTIPKMEPGKQKGKNVGVLYSLPILFKTE